VIDRLTISLTTPGKIRELQIKVYRKAKSEPGYRCYPLYDKDTPRGHSGPCLRTGTSQ
jgi:hypothetical protein